VARPKGGGKFNIRKAPKGQINARVQHAVHLAIRKAGGNITKVNEKMLRSAAAQNGVPLEMVAKHLEAIKAKNDPEHL